MGRFWACVVLGAALGLAGAADAAPRRHRPAHHRAAPGPQLQGMASVYSPRFRGRRMADGTPFDPGSDSAAHRTLPLGTTARVTNLRNGRSTIVRVRDRGPHARGRVMDLSPASAAALGMGPNGTAPVSVAPGR